MRILSMHIDGYGTFAETDIDGLSPTLSVVCGPNEAGKSTLLDFVRTVLFGFPDRRTRLPQHEPLRGGVHGGSLRVLDDKGTEWVIERHANEREARLSTTDGKIGGEAELRAILGHADGGIFRSVFAFGLGELGSLAALEEDEVRDLIFTAGILGAGKSATSALRSLEDRRAALVRPRSSARANDLQRRLDELERDLRDRREAASGFASREAELRRLKESTQAARTRRAACQRRRAEIDQLLACWPVWNRVNETEARLAKLAEPNALQAGALDRELSIRRFVDERSGHIEREQNLAKLRGQLDGTQQSKRELEARRDRLNDIFDRTIGAPRQRGELADASRSVQMLRAYIGQRDQLEARRDQRAALAAHRRATPGGSRSLVVMCSIAFAVAIAVAVAGFARHQSVLGAGAMAIAVVLGFALVISRSAEKSSAPSDTADGSEQSQRGVDLERLALEIERLSGNLGLADAPLLVEVDTVAAAIEDERDRRQLLDDHDRELADTDLELEKLAGATERIESAITQESDAIDRFEREVATLAGEFGLAADGSAAEHCSQLAAFVEEAKSATTTRRALSEALEEARSDLATMIGTGSDADRVFDLLGSSDRLELEAERAAVIEEADDAEAEWELARDAELEAARLLDELLSSTEIASLELEAESVKTQLESALTEWLVLGVASSLLKTTIDRYEQERQPAVIARASELFALVTAGRYERLVARQDERSSHHGIVALSARGGFVDSGSLSRGTAEQLYLCLRLALAETHAAQTVSLPFVLDDVLVNFDPGRAKAVARAIVETARSHQVLAFTCHPHIVELLRATSPGCAVIDLPSTEEASTSKAR